MILIWLRGVRLVRHSAIGYFSVTRAGVCWLLATRKAASWPEGRVKRRGERCNTAREWTGEWYSRTNSQVRGVCSFVRVGWPGHFGAAFIRVSGSRSPTRKWRAMSVSVIRAAIAVVVADVVSPRHSRGGNIRDRTWVDSRVNRRLYAPRTGDFPALQLLRVTHDTHVRLFVG